MCIDLLKTQQEYPLEVSLPIVTKQGKAARGEQNRTRNPINQQKQTTKTKAQTDGLSLSFLKPKYWVHFHFLEK